MFLAKLVLILFALVGVSSSVVLSAMWIGMDGQSHAVPMRSVWRRIAVVSLVLIVVFFASVGVLVFG
jgi:uncharacterized membrane protein